MLQINVPTTPDKCGADFPNGCAEVTQLSAGNVTMRSTRRPGKADYDRDEWVAFIAEAKTGKYDYNDGV